MDKLEELKLVIDALGCQLDKIAALRETKIQEYNQEAVARQKAAQAEQEKAKAATVKADK